MLSRQMRGQSVLPQYELIQFRSNMPASLPFWYHQYGPCDDEKSVDCRKVSVDTPRLTFQR